MLQRFFILPLILLMNGSSALAAGIQISEGRVIEAGDEVFVEFTVSWDLAWNNDINHDAAWIFAKSNVNGYEHLNWKSDSGSLVRNHLPGEPGPEIDVSEDGLGAFVKRDETRAERGSNHWTLRLGWDYEASELSREDLPDRVDVHALEMVYVPAGPFEAGDPAGAEGPDNAFFEDGPERAGTFSVSSAGAIEVCNGPGSLCYTDGGGDQSGPIPAAYPNGYEAFYLMKYKVTQGQYADFLNTLRDIQTVNRAIHAGRDYYAGRGSIVFENGRYRARQPDWGCGFLGWADAAAFADWAALRPYTELEYEKAARGPAEPVPNEYAWGSTEIEHSRRLLVAENILAESENGEEYLLGNANYSPRDADGERVPDAFIGGEGGRGPVRVDIFETRAHAVENEDIRVASGAGYYGAVGLTGGLFERVVSVGSERGRAFRGSHGDGTLSYSGLAANTVQDWPSRTGEGLALRARNYAFDTRNLQMSNRGFGSYSAHYRNTGLGFRAARSDD